MTIRSQIFRIAREIGESVNAERVILFGSQANGTATFNSDVDLLVIADSDLPRYKRSRDIYKNMSSHRLPVDIIVYTPDEVAEGALTPLSFISQILQSGETVYAR